jgi:hypothetical protein
MSKFDVYLGRATSVSQLILVGVAAYTLYFTAIPLYQKELASEQLAKIQIEQATAEERLSFINTSYELQLDESKRIRTQNELLAGRLELEKNHLSSVQSQIKTKDDELNLLKSELQKTSESVRVAEDKLTAAARLKFIQAVEWFAVRIQLEKECEMTIIERSNVDTSKERAEVSSCDPLSSITSAISAAAQPDAKDQSGDPLGLTKTEADRLYRRAAKLVSANKDILVDVVDYSRLKTLLDNSARLQLDVDNKKTESYGASMKATLALISFGSEVSKARIEVISNFVGVLKAKL